MEAEQSAMPRNRALAPRPPASSLGRRRLSDAVEAGSRSAEDVAGSGRPSKRRRVACQYCRQSKLRCEGSDGGTQACQRCSELARPCVFDAEYRRVSKRTTLSDLVNHVELLKSAGDLPWRDFASSAHLPDRAPSPAPPSSSEAVPPAPASLENRLTGPRIASEARGPSNRPVPSNSSVSGSLVPTIARRIETISLIPAQVQHFFEM
ncbi:hypothetical protein GQ53DRAFT_148463 [Thozetella sp. PMI_491]|nr:hypothetical protein GQ53DRAFT_148463 [Thozetella sp. PMI_491]